MKKILFILAAIYVVYFSGCGEKTEDFSRYPSVSIPQFEQADYIKLLSDKNSEVVCSAIVSLGEQAADMGGKLSDEKIQKTSAEYIAAADTYKKITGLLNSCNPRVVAASLRFLQLFSSRYKAKEELIQPVLKIKSNNPMVLYEEVNTLSLIVNKNSNVPIQKVRRFLDDPSWIVSRSAYLLVNSLESNTLRRELINKYRATRDTKEKLLILTAMAGQYDDYVADFLLAEALSANDSKIRHTIFEMLSGAKNQEKILAWLDENYEKLAAIDGEYLFQRNALTMTENFSSNLLSIFIRNDFPANEKFLESLSDKLEEYKEKTEDVKNNNKADASDVKKLSNLMQLQKAVQASKLLSERWSVLKEKVKALNIRAGQLQKEYNAIAKEYISKVDTIFKKYDISDKKRQEYEEGVLDSRDYLKEMLADEKEAAVEKNN